MKLIKLPHFTFLNICFMFVYVCMSTRYMYAGTCGIQNRVLDSLELD